MKALVVYESMFGNTHEVAGHIADGLREAGVEVTVVAVGAATLDKLQAVHLVVVGGPTHVHSMARESTRESAVEQAEKQGLPLEPGAAGPGLREWFDALPVLEGPQGAAFDTRFAAAKVFTGEASHAIARRMRAHGMPMVVPAASFLVDKRPELLPGEDVRAQEWGRTLAAAMALAPATHTSRRR